MVGDYQNDGQWKELSLVDLSLGNLKKIINSMMVVDDDDQLIWKLTTNGKFLVTSLYNQHFSNLESPCWSKAWVKGLIPKINVFFQTVLQNKILTIDNLKIRGLCMPSVCLLCM